MVNLPLTPCRHSLFDARPAGPDVPIGLAKNECGIRATGRGKVLWSGRETVETVSVFRLIAI